MSECLPKVSQPIKKAFVAYLDTIYGTALVERLTSGGVVVVGLLHDPYRINSVSPKVKQIYETTDKNQIYKALIDSDFIVYELVDDINDALTAIRFLSSNPTAFCSNASEYPLKRFVLISSLITWFATPMLQEEDGESEPLTEDQFCRRVPHVKYLAWRDLEKIVASVGVDPATAAVIEMEGEENSGLSLVAARSTRVVGEMLLTYVVFSGVQYGKGEVQLEALFRQAWNLGAEGLPVFGNGKQYIPMIHVTDLAAITSNLLQTTEPPESRYIVAADDAELSWSALIEALNIALGNGKTFFVPSSEFCFYDSVEFFTMNLRVTPQIASDLLPEEEWLCKTGFVENINTIVQEFRLENGITPLRIVLTGPPLAGKSYAARRLAKHFSLPHLTIADAVTDYKYQLIELTNELKRIRDNKYQERLREVKAEKLQQILEERRTAKEDKLESLQEEGAATPQALLRVFPDEDEDDVDDEGEIIVQISPEDVQELKAQCEEDEGDDGRSQEIQIQLDEVKKVLAMIVKKGEAAWEREPGALSITPPNLRDRRRKDLMKEKSKKEKRNKKSGLKSNDNFAEVDLKPARLNDTALAIILRWRLTRSECRNKGYILDGFPKSVKQARILFEESMLEPTESDNSEQPLDPEMKKCLDNIFPNFVLNCTAHDTYLLQRLELIQEEHPHNNAECFQRRLENFKHNTEGILPLVSYLESAQSISDSRIHVRAFNMEDCPLIPSPPPISKYDVSPLDSVIQTMVDYIGSPHNFGPSPQDVVRERERMRLFQLERDYAVREEFLKLKAREAEEVARMEKESEDEKMALEAMKSEERRLLEERKAPLRAYLMEAVMPLLTKGLIEVCEKRPEDPVDYLAEWLFRHNPDDEGEQW